MLFKTNQFLPLSDLLKTASQELLIDNNGNSDEDDVEEILNPKQRVVKSHKALISSTSSGSSSGRSRPTHSAGAAGVISSVASKSLKAKTKRTDDDSLLSQF